MERHPFWSDPAGFHPGWLSGFLHYTYCDLFTLKLGQTLAKLVVWLPPESSGVPPGLPPGLPPDPSHQVIALKWHKSGFQAVKQIPHSLFSAWTHISVQYFMKRNIKSGCPPLSRSLKWTKVKRSSECMSSPLNALQVAWDGVETTPSF